ncbi:chromate transporter [Marinicrinis sediminis]|uniref:Chromate transporter n=1 Tax=Marinicrinis sediminis TaxID=1652465 RepID=A0ABW5REG7_9BACL
MSHDSKRSGFAKMAEVFWASLKLGLTSFGGPVAHLGYFRDEYVVRRKWLTDQAYADIVALCQFLPGPASSQVGISVGWSRAGKAGAFAAWLGFTLPSALFLMMAALWMQNSSVQGGWIHGLKLLAVVIVAQAVWGMGKTLATGAYRFSLAMVSAAVMLLFPEAFTPILLIGIAGLIGWLTVKTEEVKQQDSAELPLLQSDKRWLPPWLYLGLFGGLLIAFPMWNRFADSMISSIVDVFYRTGSFVFGGGHVVLPLLENEVVKGNWLTSDQFLAGYGLAQAVPGPLFTFSSYIGGALDSGWTGAGYAMLAVAAIFLPSFLLIFGVLPYWSKVKKIPSIRKGLVGVNAAVVGILLAVWIDPILTSSLRHNEDAAFVLILLALAAGWKLPPWVLVVLSAGFGQLLF